MITMETPFQNLPSGPPHPKITSKAHLKPVFSDTDLASGVPRVNLTGDLPTSLTVRQERKKIFFIIFFEKAQNL